MKIKLEKSMCKVTEKDGIVSVLDLSTGIKKNMIKSKFFERYEIVDSKKVSKAQKEAKGQ